MIISTNQINAEKNGNTLIQIMSSNRTPISLKLLKVDSEAT